MARKKAEIFRVVQEHEGGMIQVHVPKRKKGNKWGKWFGIVKTPPALSHFCRKPRLWGLKVRRVM